MRRASPPATSAVAAHHTQTASNPHASRNTSATCGPTPNPIQMLVLNIPMTLARRAWGARSNAHAVVATFSSASPSPMSSRASSATASSPGATSTSGPAASSTPPSTAARLRPRRSPNAPAPGRSRIETAAVAPVTRPISAGPPPSSVRTNTGSTGA